MSNTKDLAKVIRKAEISHMRLRHDHIVNCHPNIKGWDKAAWERDFPHPGDQDEFVAQAILDAGYSKADDA